jgi:uncharacterized protein YecE (DUF72 family)
MNTLPALHVGMGGWDLPPFEKVFYPPTERGFRKLHYYAQFFDSVEVNATFYNSAFSPEQVRRWLDDVSQNPRFVFTVKLFRGFTHTYDGRREDYLAVLRTLDLLKQGGRLGGLVMQFPASFVNGEDQRRYLADLARAFGSVRIFAEVRHNSWHSPLMLNFFQESGLHLVNVDLPQIRRHMPFTGEAWGGAAYVRLMGRNALAWEHPQRMASEGRSEMQERYFYLYSPSELQTIAEKVRTLRSQGNETFVVFHNDPEAQSLLNGFQFRHMMTKRKVLVPDRLLRRFPGLSPVSVSVNVGHPLFSSVPLPLHPASGIPVRRSSNY